MAKKTKSESDKRYYSGYNPEKQREKRKNKHLKNHPNDVQAKKSSTAQRRTKPTNKGGWLTRENAHKIYIGKLPGKDEQPINVLNAMAPSEQKAMAKFAAQIRKMHNRFQYENKKQGSSKVANLGYAG